MQETIAMQTSQPSLKNQPVDAVHHPAWWRVRLMWFVVGGPLAVVVASFTTLALAILNPDPVLVAEPTATASQRPAIEMRNHAATAVAPPAKR